jgi:predicted nucleic acid-binding protein
MILVDTSAWMEYDRATGSPVDLRLSGLIAAGDDLAVTEPVIAEVAAGARTDEREAALRRLLARFHLLPVDGAVDFDGAVTIYRRCRRAGVTPRGLLDCVIAAIALRYGAFLLAYDADMARIADVLPLRLDEATPRPRSH